MEEDELKLLQQHRDLFPTQEMYDEFLLVRKMNKEERKAYSEKRRERIKAMTVKEVEEYDKNMMKGFQLFLDFAKKELPELVLYERMKKTSQEKSKPKWEDINRKIEETMRE